MNKLKRYLQNTTTVKKISDLIFLVAISVSAYTLITTYIVRKNLPAGVCPVNTNSKLFYVSIVLLLISFVLSLFDRKKQL